jgi:hypothetical protein
MSSFKKVSAALVAVAALGFSGSASAAALMTSNVGYTGPTIDIGGIGNPYYEFTAGPVSLLGGVTYTAGSSSSVIGRGGYGLNNNGSSDVDILGTNTEVSFITLVFDTAVGMFGGGFNYASFDDQGTPGYGPVILRAFDESDVLIASYDLAVENALISTPGGNNAFEFRGIDGQGQLIKKFEFGGSFATLRVNSTDSAIPEPGTWALMILGFGAAGTMLRARRRNLMNA